MQNKTFVGFSTRAEKSGKRSWVLYDIELIKRDLYNHFNTRKGERIMRPEFGCDIWNYIMEPNIETTRGAIILEIERVVRSDTRLEVRNVQIIARDYGIIVAMDLIYRPFQTVETFTIKFDKRQEVT